MDKIHIADRETVESNAELILKDTFEDKNVAFLVVGDPFGATTHSDLYMRAVKKGIAVSIVHNASIINAIGSCGLQLYSYGHVISIPFFTETWRPTSFLDRIDQNYARGLHTLCLLDIRVKERTDENILKNLPIYEDPRFMTVPQALRQILLALNIESLSAHDEDSSPESNCDSDKISQSGRKRTLDKNSLCVGMMRIGSSSQKIISGTIGELLAIDEESFGPPLHSLIIPGPQLHDIEYEMLQTFAVTPQSDILRFRTHEMFISRIPS